METLRHLAALALLLAASAAGAEGLSLSVEGAPVSFGALSPGGQRVLPEAARIHVVSPGARWTLKIRATGPLRAGGDPRKQLPLSRFRFGPSGGGLPTAVLSEEPQVVLAAQDPTPEAGRVIVLDYALLARWGDQALAAGDSYTTQVVFALETDGPERHYAAPTPFSPNGDGILDQTTFHCSLSAPAASAAVVREDGTAVATPGPPAIAKGGFAWGWDGRGAQGQVVPDGAYRFEARDSGGGVACRVPVVVQSAPRRGLATVRGVVHQRGAGPLAQVTVRLRSAGGAQVEETVSDRAGAFSFSSVGEGPHFLDVQMPLYLALRTPLFDVPRQGEVRQDVELVHNHSLVVGLTGSRSRAAVGELIDLLATVKAVGTTEVEGVELDLQVGAGLRVLDPQQASRALGTLQPGEERRVRLRAVVLSRGQDAAASASVQGLARGERVEAGPARFRLRVLEGELTGLGGIYGRVCFDVDGDGRCGPAEPPARGAVVFLEEGSHAQADRAGRYHFSPVLPGWHALLAGPGPLQLGLRPGAPPMLPRRGTGTAKVKVPAAGFVAVDVALPPPPGFSDDPAAWDAPTFAEDEGEVLPLPRSRALAARVEEADEGEMEDGRMVGLMVVKSPPPAPGALSAFPSGAPASAHLAPSAPATDGWSVPAGEPGAPSTALVGVGEAAVYLDLRQPGPTLVSTPQGRLSFHLQHRFSDGASGALVVDTARDGRAQSLAAVDPSGSYREHGDDAQVAMSAQERVQLRLDGKRGYAQLGRFGVSPGNLELLWFERQLLGTEVGATLGPAELRAFAGFAADARVTDVLPGEDSVGPYPLSSAPVLPGSERLDVETRDHRGETLQRIRLHPGADYVIDEVRGLVHLARPLPRADPSGQPVLLVVRYQIASTEPLLSGFVTGARVQAGTADRNLGLAALYQARGAEPVATVVAHGALEAGRVGLSAEAGAQPTLASGAPAAGWQDRAAGRLRLSVRATERVSVFGYALTQGAGWEADIRSRSEAPTALSPFGLLDQGGRPAVDAPALALALGETERPGFFLSEARGRSEVGVGTRAEQGPARGVALYRRAWGASAEDSRHHADLAVRARVSDRWTVYGAQLQSGRTDEPMWSPVQAPMSRSILGTLVSWQDLRTQVEYEHHRRAPDAPMHGLTLRARYDRSSAFQPAAMLGQWARVRDGALVVEREAAVGQEGVVGPGVQTFAYLAHRFGGASPGPRAFAGLRFGRSTGDGLNLRYDLRGEQARLVHSLYWDGRLRLGGDLTLHSDGQAQLGAQVRRSRLGVAYVPATRLRALARVEDEVAQLPEGRTLTRTGAVDVSYGLGGSLRVDSKLLVVRRRLDDLTTLSGLGGLGVGLALGRGWDVGGGARWLQDAAGGAPGATVEVGYALPAAVRVALGINAARRPEVFTLAREAPGVFLSISGAHGGAFGAPRSIPPFADQVEEVDRAPPADLELAASPPEAPVHPGAFGISGRLFVDWNANGAFDEGEPTVDGAGITAQGRTATTDAAGRFELAGLTGAGARLSVAAGGTPPGHHVPEVVVDRQAESVVRDLMTHYPAAPAGAGEPVEAPLPRGTVRGVARELVRFPLAAWAAGLPLSAEEANQLDRVGEKLQDNPRLQLVVYSHAQTVGAPRGAMRRAVAGGNALKRYLQAVQMVPGNRVGVVVLPPPPGADNPLGYIELMVVEVEAR